MKTPALNFGNDQILVMRNFVKMSRRIRWSENEFSHSLSLEPTGVDALSSAASRVAGSRVAGGSVLGR